MNKQQIEELRQKYINNPPEGMTAQEVREMDVEDLLDMDYFLHEDDDLFFDDNSDDVFPFEFIELLQNYVCFAMPAFCRLIFLFPLFSRTFLESKKAGSPRSQFEQTAAY